MASLALADMIKLLPVLKRALLQCAGVFLHYAADSSNPSSFLPVERLAEGGLQESSVETVF